MDSLYIDYENSLIGRAKSVSSYNFFGSDAGGANQQRALNCIRYALEKVLEWSPSEAIKRFDEYIIREMKLDKIISYIRFPRDVPKGDVTYILSLLYPKLVSLNYQEMVEEIYKRVLEGGYQFPREYFSGPDGYFHYCACLNYLLSTYTSFPDLYDMYNFMLSPEGNRFLHKYRLRVPRDLLGIDINECLYEITKNSEESARLYYALMKFEKELKKAK